ncbi:hypothetical protein E5288_WYG019439 [Bos mutus]|uniref:Uncharacterized protein n=1 Tax=Bos mutus TaxID=72004 RepID=A0A6B0S8H2_9CETA|nr:hypothetical protein [Bos mutus]
MFDPSLWDICHPGDFEGETSALGSGSGVTLEMVDFVTTGSGVGVTLEIVDLQPQVQGCEGGFTLEIVDVWTQVQDLGRGVPLATGHVTPDSGLLYSLNLVLLVPESAPEWALTLDVTLA